MERAKTRDFILAAERIGLHHMYCLDNCLQVRHFDDDGLKGIERACLTGCMESRFGRISAAAHIHAAQSAEEGGDSK